MDLVKSPNDYRKYRIVHLNNGIKTLLISDINDNEENVDNQKDKKETKIAAAALNINVGSFDDPTEVEGLAHFLEHMVFMGSEKYSTENDFSAFVKSNGGSENACTSDEFTNFHFEVQPDHFQETLDRFAQFFISPLLREDAVNREIRAVDSEFQRSLQEDSCRIEQILIDNAKKSHPYSKFTWGNKESLSAIPEKKGIDVMKLLRQFFQHYCNRQATLAMCSTESLDTLEEWARKYFSELPTRGKFKSISTTTFDFINPFEFEDFHKLYYVLPVQNVHTVELKWVCPSNFKNFKYRPSRYVSSLITHKGPGSIYNTLQKKGYISSIDYWITDYTMNSFVEVSFELTDEGMDNVKEVLHSFFQYTAMLKKQGASRRIHEEIKKMSSTEFRFLDVEDPGGYVEGLAGDMQLYPDEELLTTYFYMKDFNAELIEEMQNVLKPETVNIFVTSKKFKHLCTEEAKWFGTKYFRTDIPKEWLDPESCGHIKECYFLPADNQFIAENFEIKKTEDPKQLYPIKLEESDFHRIWFKQDHKFCLPKAECTIKLMLPIHGDPAHYFTCVTMFDYLLDYVLTPLDHETCLASIYQSSGHDNNGSRTISVSGYNDKVLLAFQKHMEFLTKFEFSEKDFQVCKEQICRNIRNDLIVAENLLRHLGDQLTDMVVENEIETWKRIETFSVESFNEFKKIYLSEMYIECLFQGNLTREDAKEFYNHIKKSWNYKPVPRDNLPKFRLLKFPNGRSVCRHLAFNPNDPNTVVNNYFQIGQTNMYLRTVGQILEHIMNEPVFDYLRTQKQLGYVVDCSTCETNGIQGFAIFVQTQKFSADEVDNEIESFLTYFESKLRNFTSEEYQKYITSFIATCKYADLSLSDEVERHWTTIDKEEYLFDLRYKKIEIIEKISKSDVIDFLHKYFINKDNRKVLCIQVIGHQVVGETSDDERNDSGSESGNESDSDNDDDDDTKKVIPCPDDIEINEFKPIEVDCGSGQYTRCITDFKKFREENGFFPFSKLVY